MEDPFARAPHEKHVFNHIKESDIAKYIVGSSYLGKEKLDLISQIGMHHKLGSQKHFLTEMILDTGLPKVEMTESVIARLQGVISQVLPKKIRIA